MSSTIRSIRAGLICAALAVSGTSFAALKEPLPDPLRGWVDWVLHGARDRACPPLAGQERRVCGWPGKLELSLSAKGGRFGLGYRIYREGWFTLPGDAGRWPQDVKSDGKPVPVIALKDRPAIELGVGDHAIEGSFEWDRLPEALSIPEEAGLLSATVDGRPVPNSNREGGQLLLRRDLRQDPKAEGGAADALDLRVQRRVVDEVPLRILTRLELRVSGRERELILPGALLPGFVPMLLEGGLAARVETEGRLRLQLRPGRYNVVLTARSEGPVAELRRPKQPEGARDGGQWPADEVWVFEAHPELRQVSIEGVNAVDPQQTTLPPEWKALPAYAVTPGATMKLVEQQRGQADAAPDRLSLHRAMRLDFDGAGFTVQDRLTGQLESPRLEAQPGMELGRVLASGQERLITRVSPDAPLGVELRRGPLTLQADARLPRRGLSAVGWNLDVQSLEASLQLPPGWRLFHATGVDRVGSSWVGTWTLLDLFMVLVTTAAATRLYGRLAGLLTLSALVLAYPEAEAPKGIWLALLAAEALVRALHHPSVNRVARGVRLGLTLWLALWTVGFALGHVRDGLHPQLENGGAQMGEMEAFSSYQKRTQEEVQASLSGPGSSGGSDAAAAGAAADLSEREEAKPRSRGKVATLTAKAPPPPPAEPATLDADPQAAIQTGPGLPRWDWTRIPLEFSGPVERVQEMGLWLLSPKVNLILSFLRVGLLAALLLRLAGIRLLPPRAVGAALALLVALPLLPATAHAESAPSPELLNELRQRLLERPECMPNCVSVSRMALEATAFKLRIRMSVSAATTSALPLPGKTGEWTPEAVWVEGKSASGVFRTEDGTLWLPLEPGLKQIQLEGALPDREQVQLALPARPHRTEATVQGWKLTGLHADGQVNGGLQLSKRAQGLSSPAAGETGAPVGPLPPFVRVERTVEMGLAWTVTTRVERLTPVGSAVVLELPLLEGEAVTTPDVRVEGSKVLLNLAPGVQAAEWTSVLSTSPKVTLRASKQLSWVELWRIDASPIWHVTAEGVPPVAGKGGSPPEYRPWPGESLSLNVVRPRAVEGQTLTVDGSSLSVSPGQRATDLVLQLNFRASRAATQRLTLPEGAVLQNASLNGGGLVLHPEGRSVSVPISPGVSSLQLSFRIPEAMRGVFRVPSIDLGAPSVNSAVELHAGERWVLAVGGPPMGPAVLFWGFLVVLIAVSVGLGRIRWTPLKSYEWGLLGLGLSQVPLEAAALVVAWLLALGLRGEKGSTIGVRWRFNGVQLLLVGLTVAALSVLSSSIYAGLLGQPQMQVQGNGSTAQVLRWYQDRIGSELPRPWVLSAPILLYRGAMLLWALWLALALMRWLRWGWSAFSRGALWRPKPPVAPVVPPAPGGPGLPTGGRSHH